MTRPPTESLPPTDDTPVAERPPYAEPGRSRAALVALALVALVVLALVVALVRAAGRALRPTHDREVIMFPAPDQPFAGRTYRAEFYDDNYRQLTGDDLWVALPALHGPAADAALDAYARQCAAEVESRDAQRCFSPRLVVFGVDGRPARTWRVAA